MTAYPLIPRSAYERWLPLQAVCTPQTSPVAKPKFCVPAISSRVASAPVRPRRLSRTCAPWVNAWRCGCRSPMCRPVMSNSSVASVGTGRASTRPSTVYGEPPVLVRSAFAFTRPESVSSIVSASVSCAPASAAWTVTVLPSCSTLWSWNDAEKSWPSRCPLSPGRPNQPAEYSGTIATGRLSSSPLPVCTAPAPRLRSTRAFALSSPRSAPQCRTDGRAGPEQSSTRLTPAERSCSTLMFDTVDSLCFLIDFRTELFTLTRRMSMLHEVK